MMICNRCVMDNNSDDFITFDSHGNCNYCNYALSRSKNTYYPSEIGNKILENKIKEIKERTRNDKYNCIMGISGGLDSSYLLYLGAIKWNLKILAIHVDDGFNSIIAMNNIIKLSQLPNVDMKIISPNKDEYIDLLKAFIRSGVPGIAIPQDNIIGYNIYESVKKYKIKYFLSGANFALESILQKDSDGVPSSDNRHIKDIHKRFGETQLKQLKLISIFKKYIVQKFIFGVRTIRPLDFINYNSKRAFNELNEMLGYEYYGSKHGESEFTKFVQNYYLPLKFNFDKRKSHLSSLIVSNQLSRQEALLELEKPTFTDDYYRDELPILLNKLGISPDELHIIMKEKPKKHSDYKRSIFNKFKKIAIKLRKLFDE